MGLEGVVGPLVMFGRNDVGVGVEEDGREVGVGAWPFHEDEWLALDELDGLGLEGEGVSLRREELGGFVVARGGLGGVDLEVLLEPGYDASF